MWGVAWLVCILRSIRRAEPLDLNDTSSTGEPANPGMTIEAGLSQICDSPTDGRLSPARHPEAEGQRTALDQMTHLKPSPGSDVQRALAAP